MGTNSDSPFTSDAAAMDRRLLLEQAIMIRFLLRENGGCGSTNRDYDDFTDILKEDMALNNHLLTDVSTDLLTKALLLRLLDEREEGRAMASSSSSSSEGAESDRHLIDAATAAADNKKKAAAAAARKKRRRKQKQNRRNRAAAKHEKTNLMPMSWLRGGIIILLFMMVAFGSTATTLNSPFSLIRQSDASGEGEARTLPPSASRSLPKKKHAASTSPEIVSPLPAVVPAPIFSPAAVTNHRMNVGKLRSSTTLCFDTYNWKDNYGEGCDFYESWYEDEPGCPDTYSRAGLMGPATKHCCFCRSPSSSNSPTKSATPSSSFNPSSSPTPICVDTPGWIDYGGGRCDDYGFENENELSCSDTEASLMGSPKQHCCNCGGGIRTVTVSQTHDFV